MAGIFRAEDWVTIYQSELAARAVDRESHEHIAALAEGWAAAPDDLATRLDPTPLVGTGHDGPAGCARPDAPVRPPAAGAAPDADRDEGAEPIARLADLAHLEQRLPPRP